MFTVRMGKRGKVIYVSFAFMTYRIKSNMLLVIFLGLIATLTLVSGDCGVGTQGVNFVNFPEVGIWVCIWFLKQVTFNLIFIGAYIIVIFEEWKTNLMSLAILFRFLCAQHVSEINISIIRCSFCRLKPAKRAPLETSRTKPPTHKELRTRRLM